MPLSIADDATSSGEEDAVLTPSTESVASFDGTEPQWHFKGSLVGPFLEEKYRPQCAPALTVHHGRLFCLWTAARGSDFLLVWSSLKKDGRWDYAREVVDPAGVAKRPVNVVGTPAIADLNGILHVVFLESTEDSRPSESLLNHRDMLVHMQYDDQCQNWGKRASLGINACPSISLKGYEGRLYCGYADSDQKLCYSTWTEITGWSYTLLVAETQRTERSFAFYDFGDALHLLYAYVEGEVGYIHDLAYDRSASCWLSSQSPQRFEEQFLGGLDVTSCGGLTYIVYQDNTCRPMLTTTNLEGWWAAPEKVHSEASWKLPAIAIVDENLTCVWVAGPDSHRKLLWSQRSTTFSISMNEWMSGIDSDLYLSELSIPGSHESCATIAVPWIQCQNLSIEDQLNSGIRYFDFRCGLSFGRLHLFHGRSPLGFTLTDVLARMYAWLNRAPKEAIILQIKMEGGSGDEIAFEELLRSEFNENAKFWALGNTIPRLGAIRGKIQLIRRFQISKGTLGIDVRRWANNSPKFTIPLEQHESVVVQDEYEYTDVIPTFTELIRRKSSAVDALVAAAKGDENPRAWYLNWCNAYALPFSFGVVATPADIAIGRYEVTGTRRHFVRGVNPSLFKKSFLERVKGRHGTILLDFAKTPDPHLVAAIILTNTFN